MVNVAKLKLNEKILKESPVGETILKIKEISKGWTSLAGRLERCYVTALETSQPTIDPYLVKTLIPELESNPIISTGIGRELLLNLKDYISIECSRITSSFEVNLRSFCTTQKLYLDGRFPNYIIDGFLQVNVSPNEGICKIGRINIRSLLIESVATTVLNVIKEEAERSFDKSAFLEELYSAYERAILLQRLTFGSPIPIQDVLIELIIVKQSSRYRKTPIKSNYSDYTPEFFKRDLAKVMKSGSNVIKSGKRLELMPTSFAKEAFPILVDGAVRYVGRIKFTEGNP